MKRRSLLYIPIGLLFLFALSSLALHYANIGRLNERFNRDASLPFGHMNGRTYALKPQAIEAGIQPGDRIEAINGRELGNDDTVLFDELRSMQVGRPINLTMSRPREGGERERYDTAVTPVAVEKDLAFYAGAVVNFLFLYVLPTFCILLAFWVLFVRPFDPLAWILLFVLLGLGSLSLETYWNGATLIGAFQKIFFAGWALGMLLFGIYFPERWKVDIRLPFLKWIFIVPLGFQIVLTLAGILNANTGINLFQYLGPLPSLYGSVSWLFNMVAISLFFSALAHKAGTTENPDARRRLYVMLYGTSLAITPSFLIVIYRIITGAQGSFTEIVPFWIAVFALLMMLLFPITMAYVIVVYRAMDVSVVVRQGLQYALAKGGIRVIQLILLFGIGGLVWWSITNYGFDIGTQFAFIVGGVALVPLIDLAAKPLRL